ncbi:MAG: T9SS type A sorting domain-containing protein [Bacteroidetes bacterium]|nr:T9SS type A sorting domain-containing protein [Bacteroidota bacterium]
MRIYLLLLVTISIGVSVKGQTQNCFLEDFSPKYTTAPPYINATKPTASPNVTITINGRDTLGKVSPYLFGNAVAVWVGQNVNNSTVVGYLQMLRPTLIRFPGGSWSDIYFWNEYPNDIPDSTIDGTTGKKHKFYPQVGSWYKLTPDQYYDFRDKIGAEGLITVNYAYARYGQSENPVAKAAHLAAEWVRYDAGRTKFWEVGNENAGPWEEGFMIDTTMNFDGQPSLISGRLYGKHFKVFYDSMKTAARQVGATIYIGGQILHYGTPVFAADAEWNSGFFAEVGDTVDFYVVHNYFGNNATTIAAQISNAISEITNNASFIRSDIAAKGAANKPIAMTEWNCKGPDAAKISIANGMQAVVLLSEMMKYNYGMSCRWLLANWDTDGMFYFKDPPEAGIPLWNPRPDFYYLVLFQRVIGDHCISTSVSGGASNVHAYATRFSSGHTGIVVLNRHSSYNYTVRIIPKDIGVGEKYYVYSLTGAETATMPTKVAINGYQPTGSAWGPLDNLLSIPAYAYSIGDTILLNVPAKSMHFILVDAGTRSITKIEDEQNKLAPTNYELYQNYPNPFNPATVIEYELQKPSCVTLCVYDTRGVKVAILENGAKRKAGRYTVMFNGSTLSSGVYFYTLVTEYGTATKSMVLLK